MRRLLAIWRPLGLLLLSGYVAFTVLDLDASQLQFRPGLALAAQSLSLEEEREAYAIPAPAVGWMLPPVLKAQGTLRLQPIVTRFRHARGAPIRARRCCTRLDGTAAPQSADPA